MSEWLNPMRDAIMSVSFFAVGVAVWRGASVLRRRRFRRACLYIGPAVALGLLAEAVFGAPSIPFSWRAVVYVLAVLAFGIGATERGKV